MLGILHALHPHKHPVSGPALGLFASDSCSALDGRDLPRGCVSQAQGCSGFPLGLANGGTSARLGVEERRKSEYILPLSPSSIFSSSDHMSMVPARTV